MQSYVKQVHKLWGSQVEVVLSALLFIWRLDEVIKTAWIYSKKYTVGYRNLQPVTFEACAFVDDIILNVRTDKALENKIWSEVLKNYILIIIFDVTKVIANKKININVEVEVQIIEQVEQYKYLGIIYIMTRVHWRSR